MKGGQTVVGKEATRRVVVGVAVLLIGGCSIDRVSIGMTARQVEASAFGLRAKTVIPAAEIDLIHEINYEWDSHVRLQIFDLSMLAGQPIEGIEIEGNFQSLSLGLSYYPFNTWALGFEFGTEGYFADYEAEAGDWWKVKIRDTPYGGGIGLAIKGEQKLWDEDWQALWRLGYNETWTKRGAAEINFDGFSFSAAINYK